MPITNPDYSKLDNDQLADAIGLKAKHIPILITSFLEESSVLIDALANAIDEENFLLIESTAHSIKGSAGNLRFEAIYEMAKEIELAAKERVGEFAYSAYLRAIAEAINTIPR